MYVLHVFADTCVCLRLHVCVCRRVDVYARVYVREHMFGVYV